jgi:hypothetical protein
MNDLLSRQGISPETRHVIKQAVTERLAKWSGDIAHDWRSTAEKAATKRSGSSGPRWVGIGVAALGTFVAYMLPIGGFFVFVGGVIAGVVTTRRMRAAELAAFTEDEWKRISDGEIAAWGRLGISLEPESRMPAPDAAEDDGTGEKVIESAPGSKDGGAWAAQGAQVATHRATQAVSACQRCAKAAEANHRFCTACGARLGT